MPAIPLIDVAPLFDAPGPARDAADRAVLAAAEGAGFMTVTGLPGETLAPERRRALLAVFGLAEEEKRRLWRQSFDPSRPNVYRGWFPLQAGHPTWKEGIDIGPDAVDPSHARPGDPLTEATPLPDPSLLPGWREAVAAYYREMEATGAALLRSLARGLGLPETRFEPAFRGGISTLRLIRYPERTPESFGAEADRLWVGEGADRRYITGAAHADSGFVTLLAQDGVEGLEAEARDGSWVAVPPSEGTLAVNFGRLLERWTGGRIRATVHRVTGRGRERCSIPFFYEPAVDAVIEPIPGLGEPFAPFAYGDHLWEGMTRFVEFRAVAGLRPPRGVGGAAGQPAGAPA